MLEPCQFINGLDQRSLTAYADHLRSLLHYVEDQIKDRLRSDEYKLSAAARRKKIFEARDIMTSYILNGMSPDRAIAATGKITGIEINVLEICLSQAKKRAKGHRRDRKIMQMVATGWTDKAIGERLNLHPKSVNRLVNKARKVG